MRKSTKCSVFRAKHKDFPEVGLIVRVYENCAVNLMNMLYLKILKHIGKKHPYIVQTWDIFKTEKNLIMVFQEYANRNDLQQYLERSDSPGEKQICEWARELYQAMDYLGDMGVCHRNICPKYVLLSHKDLSIRLTGFHRSITYWNVVKDDVYRFPCLERKSKKPDFQAPEVFGNGNTEEFDPILADTWSFGAVIFFCVKKTYPYDTKVK